LAFRLRKQAELESVQEIVEKEEAVSAEVAIENEEIGTNNILCNEKRGHPSSFFFAKPLINTGQTIKNIFFYNSLLKI
jgi:hypothetical protein